MYGQECEDSGIDRSKARKFKELFNELPENIQVAWQKAPISKSCWNTQGERERAHKTDSSKAHMIWRLSYYILGGDTLWGLWGPLSTEEAITPKGIERG